MTKKCETCIIRGTCTHKEIEGSLCEEMKKLIVDHIDKLRDEADMLEEKYGLQQHYLNKMSADMDRLYVFE